MQAFDFIFIVDYLTKAKIKFDNVTVGNKILSITIPLIGLTFLDTLSYMTMSLDKASKSLGIKSLTKGFFPYLINSPAHYDLVLDKPPEARHFDLAPQRQQQFDEWRDNYEGPYVFKDELAHYNLMDTLLLYRVALRFMKNSFQVSESECMLIVQASL